MKANCSSFNTIRLVGIHHDGVSLQGIRKTSNFDCMHNSKDGSWYNLHSWINIFKIFSVNFSPTKQNKTHFFFLISGHHQIYWPSTFTFLQNQFWLKLTEHLISTCFFGQQASESLRLQSDLFNNAFGVLFKSVGDN